MNQIKVGAMLSYFSILLTFIVGLIYTPILIRFLGASDYGIYSLVLSFSAYLSIMDMGIGNAIVRYISRNRIVGTQESESNLLGQFMKFFIIVGVITILLGFSLVINIPNIFETNLKSNEIKIVQTMLIILTLNFALSFPLNVYTSVLQAYEKFIHLKLINILRVLLVPMISVVLLIYGARLVSLALVIASVNITLLLLSYCYYKKVLNIKLSFNTINRTLRIEILTYSLLIFLTTISDKIYWQSSQILLGIFKSPQDVAVYAIAIQFIMIFLALAGAISGLFLPKISTMVASDNYIDNLNKLFFKVSKFQFFILALAFSGFIAFGENFIIHWAGEDYSLAYKIVIIFMIPFFFDLIQNIGIAILQAKGLLLFRATTLFVSATLNIVISIPLIKIYGSVGAAISSAIFIGIGNVIILNFYYYHKVKLDIFGYWKIILRLLAPVTILTYIVYYFYNNIVENDSLAWLAWSILIYLFIYSFIYYFFNMNKNEKKNCKKVMIKLLKLIKNLLNTM